MPDNTNIVDIPQGDSHEDIKKREKIIRQFYRSWKENHNNQKIYNSHLQNFINVRMISVIETSEHAAKNYLSTLAVFKLDEILSNAHTVEIVNTDCKYRFQMQKSE